MADIVREALSEYRGRTDPQLALSMQRGLGEVDFMARDDRSRVPLDYPGTVADQARPHQGLGRTPIRGSEVPSEAGTAQVIRTDRLGGLLHEYARAA